MIYFIFKLLASGTGGSGRETAGIQGAVPCSPAVMARDTAKLPGRMLTLGIEGFANYLCPTFGRKLPSLGYEDSL